MHCNKPCILGAWALQDRALLEGPADGFDVYTDFKDNEGFPTCNPGCSRDSHQDGDYSGCPGSTDRRFLQFVLLDPVSFGDNNRGAATSFGAFISLYGWKTIGSQGKDWPMLVHELGHASGSPDFLIDGTRPTNRTICSILWILKNAPEKFVMMPGSGGFDTPPKLTEMEGWLIRHWWSRWSHHHGWQNDNVTWPALSHCDKLEADVAASQSDPTLDKIFKTVEHGAVTTAWAATAKALEGQGGKYRVLSNRKRTWFFCRNLGFWARRMGL
ncbi:hypothetical protein HJFPF1_12358 [Paramyrothecium foliicola]|nr:hypothetical protein HJFPF1_12358 [Paramyrothecium foliicola]